MTDHPRLTKIAVSISLKTTDGYSSREEFTSVLRGVSAEEALLAAVDEIHRVAALYGLGSEAAKRARIAKGRTEYFLANFAKADRT